MNPASLAMGMVLAALVIAMVVVRGAIAYAHRRGMMDMPGQRRSIRSFSAHRVMTGWHLDEQHRAFSSGAQ